MPEQGQPAGLQGQVPDAEQVQALVQDEALPALVQAEPQEQASLPGPGGVQGREPAEVQAREPGEVRAREPGESAAAVPEGWVAAAPDVFAAE